MSYSIEEKKLYVNAEVVTDDFNSNPIDVRYLDLGSLELLWSAYDGSNGAVNIQVTDGDPNNGATWHDWGGNSGAVQNIGDASGSAPFEFTEIGWTWLRVNFYIGDGSTATITVNYTTKTRR